MSFTITTDVFCDECHDWTSGTSSHTPERGESWKLAKQRGWKKVKGKHLCPICLGIANYRCKDGSYEFIKDLKND